MTVKERFEQLWQAWMEEHADLAGIDPDILKAVCWGWYLRGQNDVLRGE